MESRKIVLMNLFTEMNWRHRHREHSRGRRGYDKLKLSSTDENTIMCKTDN